MIEPKYIRSSGILGHIEDLAFAPPYTADNLGKTMMKVLLNVGRLNGCYKIILNAFDFQVPFYEGLGMKQEEVEMCIRYVNK